MLHDNRETTTELGESFPAEGKQSKNVVGNSPNTVSGEVRRSKKNVITWIADIRSDMCSGSTEQHGWFILFETFML